jgi:hypothetical protein
VVAPAVLWDSNQGWPRGHHIDRSARNEMPLVDVRRVETGVPASSASSSATVMVRRLLPGTMWSFCTVCPDNSR